MRFLYNSMRQKRTPIILLSVLVVILLGVIGFLVWKYQGASANDTQKNQETSKRIITQVSNLYFVPTNEEPTVAVIQDKSKLGNDEFFKKAQNGDYLIIYQKDKIALIYREKDNKLVNVGPVNFDNQQQGQEQKTQPTEEQTEEPRTP